jgi:hypothetical protein
MAASVILAKCHKHNRTFGIRVELRENDWISTWAFPIDEAKAKREGFDRNKIKGSLRATPEYPGCPYCGGKDLVQCGGCEKMSCYGGNTGIEKKPERKQEKRADGKPQNKYDGVSFRCHWCGVMIEEIETVESFSIKSGNS